MARDLAFITARPIAHRGLHDKAKGVIENSASAFRAAIAGGFAIECDVQLTGDGEALVFHDFALARLTGVSGLVADRKASDLKALTLTGSNDSPGTLADMFALVHGQALIVCEIKSTFRGDMRLTERVAALARDYRGPLVIKSFDPRIVAHWHSLGTDIPVGIVGMSEYSHHEYDACTPAEKHAMANVLHLPQTKPDFLSWRVRDLNTAVPFLWRSGMGKPLMSWTVRTPDDVAMVKRHADQMVFEGFLPG
jgi:glycerophosphoryl diester phosphodiesterase